MRQEADYSWDCCVASTQKLNRTVMFHVKQWSRRLLLRRGDGINSLRYLAAVADLIFVWHLNASGSRSWSGLSCQRAPVNRLAQSCITWNSWENIVGNTLNRYSLAPEFTKVKLYRKELFSGYMPHDSLLVLFQQDRFTVIERSMQTNTGKRNRQRRMFHMEHVRKMQSLTLHNHILRRRESWKWNFTEGSFFRAASVRFVSNTALSCPTVHFAKSAFRVKRYSFKTDCRAEE